MPAPGAQQLRGEGLARRQGAAQQRGRSRLLRSHGPSTRRPRARGAALVARSNAEEQESPWGDAPLPVDWARADFESAALSLQALQEYEALMVRTPGDLDVLEGAVLIARHRHPRLALQDVVEQLDDLAEQVRGAAPHALGTYPLRALQAISSHLYSHRGFAGNSEDYYK